MINNWLSLTGLDWWLQGFVQGTLLIAVVAFNQRAIMQRTLKFRHITTRSLSEKTDEA